MIFKPELARLIMQGKKTATRRPANGVPCRYKPGVDYAIQPGRGKSAVGRINVVDVERQQLGDLTYREALAEGFRTTADFARYWLALYDRTLELGELNADQVLELWRDRYGRSEVWAITFELCKPVLITVPEIPLYLHRYAHRAPTTDRSQRALGEPEIIDIRIARKHRSVARAQHATEHQQQFNRLRSSQLGAQVRETVLSALHDGLDPSEQITEIERQVAAIKHMRTRMAA